MTTQIATELTQVFGNSDLFSQVKEQFEKVIKPIYGDQEDALDKIAKSKDRHCFVIATAEKISGIVVYKIFPHNEFKGADEALEIKTLFVVDAAENSNKGYGSKLYNQVENFAKSSGKFSNIVVTVSETKQESLQFFQRKGFSIISSSDKFNAKEHILAKKV